MNTQRKTELDLIRVIAITCVVLNHAIDIGFHLSEGEREELDRKLAVLQRMICNVKEARKNRPQITIQYLSPCTDTCNSAYGTGGTYETRTGICLKIDPVSRTVKLDETIISIVDISDITGDLFGALDDDIP